MMFINKLNWKWEDIIQFYIYNILRWMLFLRNRERDSFKTSVFRKGMKFCDIKMYKIKFKSFLFGYVLSNVKAAWIIRVHR